MYEWYSFSTSFPAFDVVTIFFFILAFLIMISYGGLNLHSLMNNDTEHLFMCLFTIRGSSSVKYLFMSFDYFLMGVGFFFYCLYLIDFFNIYIQDTSPLLNMWFINIFSQFVTCHQISIFPSTICPDPISSKTTFWISSLFSWPLCVSIIALMILYCDHPFKYISVIYWCITNHPKT